MYRARSALAALTVAAILVACGRLIPAQQVGFGYYGAYPSLLDFEWDEGG